MQKVFLSYASQDRPAVDQLAHELSQRGVPYWRDQDNLYAGQRWPKELGQAIAAHDCVVLVWSNSAAESHYVEMEWCTAIALKKIILPCRLDDTPLPPSLSSVQTINLLNGSGVSQILSALQGRKPPSDAIVQADVIQKLSAIPGSHLPDVLQSAKATIFDQRGWTVHGDVHYHAERDIHVVAASTSYGDRSLGILLSKVNEFWVQGVLKTSLHDIARLKISKTACAEAVDHPWHALVEAPGQRKPPLPLDKPLVDLFREAGGSLLVLGEPGSGKTIALLQLAENLIVQAEANPSQPIPVVFNLSTWSKDHKTLAHWLEQELGNKYHVSRRMARVWLRANRIILLLDGLDEVKLEHRTSCVDAINQYVADWGTPGIAVCSRSHEYSALMPRLNFNGAIRLEPLTEQQVKGLLTEAGPRLRTLHRLIETDESFRMLSQSPLVLAIMTLTYMDMPPEETYFTDRATIEQRRSQLMDAYAHRMFERKGQAQQTYSRNETTAYLSWLAKGMMKASQAVFLIEALQPGWLSARRDQWLYSVASRAVGLGVLNGFSGVLNYIAFPSSKGLMVNALLMIITIFTGLLMGVCIGTVNSIKGGGGSDLEPQRDKFYFPLMYTLLSAIACGAAGGLIHTLYDMRDVYDYGSGLLASSPDYPKSEQVRNGAIIWALFGLAFGIRDSRRHQYDDIKTTESVAWSWSKAKKGYLIGLLFGIIIIGGIGGLYWLPSKQFELSTWLMGWLGTLGVVLLFLWSGSWSENNAAGRKLIPNLQVFDRKRFIGYFLILEVSIILVDMVLGRRYHLPIPIVSGIILVMAQYFGLFAALFHGWGRKNVQTKSAPNQGIFLSVKNSLIITFIYFITSLLLFGAIAAYMIRQGQISAIHPLFVWFCLFLGMLVGTWYALDVLQHYTLRLILYIRGYAPFQYAQFLDYGTTLIFLQKVGGGYIFIHRLVMEHFASLDKQSPEHLHDAATASHAQQRVTS